MRVILIGQANHDNFGDILIFDLFLRELSNKGFDVQIYRPTETFLTRLQELGQPCKPMQKIESRSTDQIGVFVGGGYFSQPFAFGYGWQLDWWRKGEIKAAAYEMKAAGIPYAIVGPEVGPVSAFPFGRTILCDIREIYRHASLRITRTVGSEQWCKDNLQTVVDYVPDCVLLTPNYYKSTLDVSSLNSLTVHVTGRIVGYHPPVRGVQAAITRHVEKQHYEVIELFFDQPASDARLRAAESFACKLRSVGRRVVITPYNGVSGVLGILSSTPNLLTTKLHCGMTALSFGANVCCFSDEPKTKRAYDSLGVPHRRMDYYTTSSRSKLSHIDGCLVRAVGREEQATLREAATTAKSQFVALDRFLQHPR